MLAVVGPPIVGPIDHIVPRARVRKGALDRKRHELFDMKLQARRHPRATAIVAGACFAGLALGGWAIVHEIAHGRGRRWRERGRALVRVWRRPERLASRRQGAMWEDLGRRILVGALAYVATELARRSLRPLLAR